MALIDIAGGVALILFGIRFLRKGLNRLTGDRIQRWTATMQRRRRVALGAGLAFGTVAPSSTAQTLFALQLLNAGRLSGDRLLLFLLGAGIGITATVQLISFHVFEYYPVFLVLGLVGFQYGRTETQRGIGQSVLGLGFVFLAMTLISRSAADLTGNPDFQALMDIASHYRLAMIVFAAVVTVAMQSSTASIGLVLALASAGAVGLPVIAACVVGTNLGLGITALIAGWGTLPGRRLTIANFLVKLVIAIAALIFFEPLLAFLDRLPGSLTRHGADFHTAFNVAAALLGLAVASWLTRKLEAWMRSPTPQAEGAAQLTHLDSRALTSPVFALANASRETLRLLDEIRGMFADGWDAYLRRSAELAKRVRKRDDQVDALHAAIKDYLSRIPTEALNSREGELRFGLLHFTGQLESIGDIIEKEWCPQIILYSEHPAHLASQDEADLAELERRLRHRLSMASSVLTTRERSLAEDFMAEGDKLKTWAIEVQKRHYQSLESGRRDQEASQYFLEMFNILRRISGQLNTIGHTFSTRPVSTESQE